MKNNKIEISIILDFVCPYCFVSEKILEKVLTELKIESTFKFLPYELSPSPDPQTVIGEEKLEYFKKNIEGWAKKENIKINFNSLSPRPRTSLAFEGLYLAEKYSKGVEYIRAILDAYWLNNEDIGSIETLVEISGKLNIPKEKMKEVLLSRKYREVHMSLNEKVSEFDFEVVPTFYLNEKQLKEFPRDAIMWEEVILNS